MNSTKLQALLTNYIENFEYINNDKNNENYKWVIAQMFHDQFDIDSARFADMLYTVWKATDNLVDNSRQLPFYALVDYSRTEPETIRAMFRELFQSDSGKLKERQIRIDTFIRKSEDLRKKYRPESWRYANDQRSVMTYLFLNNPDENYLYKATQAHEFADCVEFYDDWGSGSNFFLDVYYRMCDELVTAMRECAPLMKTHKSRYEHKAAALHEDKELHILAFDMIYSSQKYGLYKSISYTHPDSKEKRLYMERVDKARLLQAEYDSASNSFEELTRIKDYLHSVLTQGMKINHKSFGSGIIETADEDTLVIFFEQSDERKKFGLLSSLAGGFFKFDISEIDNYVAENAALMKAESGIASKLKIAEDALAPYREYLS